MKNILCLFLIFIVARAVFGQDNNWHLSISTGFDLSINRMTTIEGEERNMTNAIRPGGYWSILVKPQVRDKTQVIFGIDHAAYKYHYRYRIDQGNGGAARSTVYIWGFPLGLENSWFKDYIGFSTSYGIKYRVNRLGSPFALHASNSTYNPESELVYAQILQEDKYTHTAHLIALFLGAQLSFNVKERFTVSINMSYNQGLNLHESFRFTATNTKPIEEEIFIDQYQYQSRASYIALGLGFNISLIHKKNINKPPVTIVNSD